MIASPVPGARLAARRRTLGALAASALSLAAARPVLAQDPYAPGLARSYQVGYDQERGAFIGTTDGRWELNPYAMVQLQNVTQWSRGEVQASGYQVRAAKLIFHGHIYDPSLTYHFQINAGDNRVVAEDIYLQWTPLPQLGFLAGQIEVPLNRQHITLEAYQQLIDRSIADQRFNLQRDIGIATYLSDEKHHEELTLGMWNGSRQDAPNDNASYLWSGRFAWNPFGPIAFREADLANSARPKLSIAAAGAYNPARVVPPASGSGPSTTQRRIAQAVGETTLRYRGLSVSVETHVREMTVSKKERRDLGGFVQVGYFVVPSRVEVVVRSSSISGDLAAQDLAREQTLGANHYFRGHRFKVQADGSRLVLHGGTRVQRARVQLEFFL